MNKLEKRLEWMKEAERRIKGTLWKDGKHADSNRIRRINRTLNKGWDISLSERRKKLRIDSARYEVYLRTLRRIGS